MSEATSGNAYRTASDLDAALVGAYQTFYTEYFIWEYFVVSDVRSDNAYAGEMRMKYTSMTTSISLRSIHVYSAPGSSFTMVYPVPIWSLVKLLRYRIRLWMSTTAERI